MQIKIDQSYDAPWLFSKDTKKKLKDNFLL